MVPDLAACRQGDEMAVAKVTKGNRGVLAVNMNNAGVQCPDTREPILRAGKGHKLNENGHPRGIHEASATSHNGEWEMLLIRTGHRLWRWYKEAERNHVHTERRVLEAALVDVWEAKRAFRAAKGGGG